MQNLLGCHFGKKGEGKTTLARAVVAGFPRVIILDVKAEYDDGTTLAYGRDAALELLEDAEDRRRFRLALRRLPPEHALEVLEVCGAFQDVLLVLDEAQRYCSPSTMPPALDVLVNEGRHRAISQLYIARRPAEINRDVTANADYIAIYRTREPRDVEYLRAYVGTRADQVMSLPKYRTLVYGELDRCPLPVLASGHVAIDTAEPVT